jgi:hypothetical protein
MKLRGRNFDVHVVLRQKICREKKTHLERLTVNAEGATVLGSIPASLRRRGLGGAADETVLKKVLKNTKKKCVEI